MQCQALHLRDAELPCQVVFSLLAIMAVSVAVGGDLVGMRIAQADVGVT